jgi:phosphatidylserine/phosphatidylglycerophosphate/cardiolipin synthase-like enzyme
MPPKIKDLLCNEIVHVDLFKRQGIMSRQWLLEKRNKPGDHPITVDNHLEFHTCASETFPIIVKDMRAAKKSIDLICWGFEPAMEIEDRKAGDWPRSLTYGDLLSQIAASGITVRLLVSPGVRIVVASSD